MSMVSFMKHYVEAWLITFLCIFFTKHVYPLGVAEVCCHDNVTILYVFCFQSKCSKMIYTLLDFLNRWLLEWCHSKQHPLQNENYK